MHGRLRKVVGRPSVEQAPRDAGQPDDEHRHEDDVHADERAGEVDLAERLVHLPPGCLRIPVVDPRHEGEDRSRSDDVVEVGDDVVRVVQRDVRDVQAERKPREPADAEHREKGDREEHGRVEAYRSAPERDDQGREDHDRRDRDDHRGRLEERRHRRPHAGHEHVVGPDDERHEAEEDERVDHRTIAPQRLPRVVRDDLGHDSHPGKDQDVDFRVRQEPEQVLPEERVASAGVGEGLAADDEAAREEEARAGHTIHQLHDPRGLERRKGQQQEEGRDELGPHEEGEPHEGEPLGAQLDGGRDEVERSEQRRGDQEDHPDEPPRLTRAGDDGERRVGGPPGLRGPAGDEKAAEHRDAAEEEAPVAHHVDLREGHVRGSNLEREHEVPESSDGEGDHPEEDHDGAVHRPELVVELGEHRPARHARLAEERADQRQRGARVGELPAHEHHQRKAEEQEQEAGDGVLDADDLVIGREDVLAPEAELLVMDFVRDVRLGCDDSLLTHEASLPIATSRRGRRT